MIFFQILFASFAVALIAFFFSRIFGPGGSLEKEKTLQERLARNWFAQTITAYRLRKKDNVSDIEFLTKLLSQRPVTQTISIYLKAARLKISVSVFLLTCLVVGFLSFFFSRIYFSVAPAAILSFFIALIPFLAIRMMHRNYLSKFDEYLPNALSVISGSIKVGHGIHSAIEAVERATPYPVCEEFSVVQAEMKLGVGLTEALDNLSKRVQSQELKIFVTGISVQQKLGGNLSELLDNLEKTIRERYALMREVKALSAQGVISAWVLFCIPIFLTAFLIKSNAKSYMGFFHSQVGQNAIQLVILFQVVAFFWIRQIIKIKD